MAGPTESGMRQVPPRGGSGPLPGHLGGLWEAWPLQGWAPSLNRGGRETRAAGRGPLLSLAAGKLSRNGQQNSNTGAPPDPEEQYGKEGGEGEGTATSAISLSMADSLKTCDGTPGPVCPAKPQEEDEPVPSADAGPATLQLCSRGGLLAPLHLRSPVSYLWNGKTNPRIG